MYLSRREKILQKFSDSKEFHNLQRGLYGDPPLISEQPIYQIFDLLSGLAFEFFLYLFLNLFTRF